MSTVTIRQFGIFFDRYYWQTAVLIAKNGLARLYRNSFLGILWMLFQPLTMVLVYSIIMPMIIKSPSTNYTLYILVSLPIWTFFSGSIIGASNSILANGETLKRCIVSSSVFPIADILRTTYTLLISFTTMYVMALLLGLAHFSFMLLLIPVYFIPVFIIISSMSTAIAFIAPYIRDVGEFASMSMTVMFWMTPIIYQISMLPPKAQMLMRFNPFFIMINPIQMLAYSHLLPGINETLSLLVLTIISVIIGFAIFRLCRRNYVYYL